MAPERIARSPHAVLAARRTAPQLVEPMAISWLGHEDVHLRTRAAAAVILLVGTDIEESVNASYFDRTSVGPCALAHS